jgi:hypothetical protein
MEGQPIIIISGARRIRGDEGTMKYTYTARGMKVHSCLLLYCVGLLPIMLAAINLYS